MIPAWFAEYLGDAAYERSGDVLRAIPGASAAQSQTSDVFRFKWSKRETFESQAMRGQMRAWLDQRYGPAIEHRWWTDYGPRPIVIDAGCGGGYSGLEWFRDVLPKIRYIGVDISQAVDVAAERFRSAGYADAAFMQGDITQLPFPPESAHVIFSEGVLHHTDSPQGALRALARVLAPGGRLLFYVYRKKGPIREFTDDYVRARIQSMTPEAAWSEMLGISLLGRALGQLDVRLTIPQAIPLLDIPQGEIDLQRFFYWHVLKAFYRPDLSLEELNHINFDWYAPANSFRQTPEEVRAWCAALGLEIERESLEEAGITVIARKRPE